MKASAINLCLNKTATVLAAVCLCGLSIPPGFADVISVDPVLAGKSFSPDPTKTFVWAAKDAKATLVFIPGGNGRLGLTDDKKDLGGFYGNTLKPLADPGRTSGQLNVVVFDSPKILDEGGKFYPTSRATDDHLMRIDTVVLHYQDKFHKPIWLMGHSNGAVSVTEFYKYLQKSGREQSIAGIVFSAGRNGADFNSRTTNLPVLFLAHSRDGCAATTNTQVLFERLKRADTAKVDYVAITGGAPEGDPCRSGFHMYNGASEAAYQAIDAFISPFYR